MYESDVFLDLLRLFPVHKLGNKKVVQDRDDNAGDYTIDERGHFAAFKQLYIFVYAWALITYNGESD